MFLKPKGNEIKIRRERMGLTRHALSMKAGLGPLAVTRMEEEAHMVHPLRAKAVADVLECKVDDLFKRGNDSEFPKVS